MKANRSLFLCGITAIIACGWLMIGGVWMRPVRAAIVEQDTVDLPSTSPTQSDTQSDTQLEV